jgi:hypothetical protein
LVNQRTLEVVRGILEERGIGIGIRIAQIRALYPAKQVRRSQIAEAVRVFEDLGLVVLHDDGRVRWRGPISPGARPLGTNPARLTRYMSMLPAERTQLAIELSEELLPAVYEPRKRST